MKRIITIVFFLALTTTIVHAQFAMEAGYNMSNLSIKSGGKKFATQAKKGADFGIAADLCVDEHRHVYFQPSLIYSSGGCLIIGKPEGDYSISMIDLHLNFVYKTGEKCSSRFFFGGGPYIGYNMSGTYRITGYDKVPAKGGDLGIGPGLRDGLKDRGLGIGVNVGYQIKKHVYLRGYYNLGIANIKSVGDPDNRIKASAMGINLGYLFANCSHKSRKGKTFFKSEPSHWRGLSKGVYSTRPKASLSPRTF